ncbi:MAG TPA: hypothetical protein DCE44_20820 [Verrucomicrobiales bacterium]|nr:hypothetical protein [Verrucomicrobiales bacterium]
MRIAAIVEGDGEVGAVPVLLRRYADLSGWPGRIFIPPVIRQPASKLFKPGQLERVVELAARKLGGPGGILVLLDCEDDCPAQLGPTLLGRVRNARPDLPSAVVLAHREYEAWFLGAASSIAGQRSLPKDLRPHPSPESIRACKEWLSDQMPRGSAYNEVEDQPALTALFDLEAARHACRSFDKCHRDLMALIQRVATVSASPKD